MTHADSLAFIPDDELFATVQRLTARTNVALADGPNGIEAIGATEKPSTENA